MPNVWIVRSRDQLERDVTDAERFGNLCPAFDRSVQVFDVAAQQRALDQVLPRLGRREDYIVLAGPMVMVGCFISAWTKLFGGVKMLVWDRRLEQYVEKTVGF